MTTIKDSEIIQLALDKYLGRPEQWCQRAWARDENHFPTFALGHRAVSRCASGAITAAIYELRGTAGDKIGPRLSKELVEYFRETHPDLANQIVREINQDGSVITSSPPPDTPAFNDHPLMTHEGVRAAMEKYRAALEEQGR